MKSNGGFFKSNWAYLIWFCFYFLFACYIVCGFTENVWLGIIITALIYGACVGLALSPVGEFILRLMENARPIETQEDKDYLLPIFEEVYDEATNFTDNINQNINLYISETMAVNAFAVGRKTITVTRGAINAFSRDELKGILAHEFGHMANGDTKALLIKSVGNGFFSIIIFILRIVMNIIQGITAFIGRNNVIIMFYAVFAFILRLIIDAFIFALIFIGDVIIALNSRHSEYLADEYAHLIGYGNDLKNALYLIKKVSIPRKATLTERLKASHPYTSARIERLENMLTKTA